MHRNWLLAVVTLSLFAAPATARTASPEATIRGYYAQISRLAERKDIVSLSHYLAPDFYRLTPDRGKIGRKQSITEAAKAYKRMSNIKADARITRVRIRETQIEVANTNTCRASWNDGKRMHPILIVNRREDVWRQYGRDWKIARSTIVDGYGTVDGVVTKRINARPPTGVGPRPKAR